MTVSTYGLRTFKLRYFLSTLLLSSLISTPLLADGHANANSLQLGIHQVSSWRAANDSELILKDHQNNQYQATLKPPCKGLDQAKSIAFTSHGSSSLDKSSSVVLPSGKRCPFKSFSRQEQGE